MYIKVTLVVIQVKNAVKFVVLVALLIMILLVALVSSVLRFLFFIFYFLFFYFFNQYDMRAPNDLEFIEQCVNLKEFLDGLSG